MNDGLYQIRLWLKNCLDKIVAIKIVTILLLSFMFAASGFSQLDSDASSTQMNVLVPRATQGSNFIQEFLAYRNSYAMVIGIDQYQHLASDRSEDGKRIKLVIKALQNQNFEVVDLINPTIDELKSAISDKLKSWLQSRNARVVFYYAGQSHEVDGNAYLSGVDSVDVNDASFKASNLSLDVLLDATIHMKARHFAMFMDACISDDIINLKEDGMYRILKRDVLEPSKHAVIACGKDQKRPGDHVFLDGFIEAIEGKFQNIEPIVNYSLLPQIGTEIVERIAAKSNDQITAKWGKIIRTKVDENQSGAMIFEPSGKVASLLS
ncbi:MAG: caspase family protein [Pseudomonadota bacterium]